MSSFERTVDYAEYLVELGKQNPAVLVEASSTPVTKGKSIHQKLLDLYVEETGKQSDDKKLQCNSHLLKKLVRREKLNCLILNLYPGNDGYSLMLRSKAGVETETVKLPYEVNELLEYIDDSELPPFLVDVLEKAQVNVFHNGCVILEVRDFRRSTNGSFDMQYVLLKPNAQTMLCDINNLTNDGHVWTQEDVFHLESRLLLATEEPLCLDPSPAVLLVANRQQYDRKKLNTPLLKRAVKKYSQAAVNRKRKFALSSAPKELQLYEFICRKREKKGAKHSKSVVDFWKQRPINLTTPESVDVEKYAKVIEKTEKDILKDNSLNLVEEQVLERDGMLDKKLLARLTIYHRPGDDAHIGELYLDHDYVEDKSRGATCRFLLGNKDSVRKYLDQFREIFTEEGRRAVKITTHRPGQAPVVTCTQTTPTNLPATVAVNMGIKPGTSSTPQPQDTSVSVPVVSLAHSSSQLKQRMPIQLALSIGPGVVGSTPPQTILTQGNMAQATNQVQLSMPSAVVHQSGVPTQRLPGQHQQASQSQSASQRLKQLGIHTSIASRNNTPSASPVSGQQTIAQIFGAANSAGSGQSSLLTPQQHPAGQVLPTHQGQTPPTPGAIGTPTGQGMAGMATPTHQQQGLVAPNVVQGLGTPTGGMTPPSGSITPTGARTPSHTPTPPPPILSPPVQPSPASIGRKASLTAESSTIHHMAQTSHQVNVGSFVQGENNPGPVSSASGHQQQTSGVANINIANITGIPPNVNIQNLTGLPGMNIANLQVNLSVSGGGSIAVPISMISSNPILQNQQGLVVSSGAHIATSQQTGSSGLSGHSTVVTMVTQHPGVLSTTSPATQPSNVVTGVLTQSSTVIPGTGMLPMPINLGTQLVPAGLKSAGQIRGSTPGMPVQLQFGQQGIQLVNLPQQRATLKPGATLQPGQSLGPRPSTSIQGPLTTTLLTNSGLATGQQVISHIPMGKAGGSQGGITTTLTPQQLLQLPQFQAQLQAFHKPAQVQQPQQQQQLQFHQILKQQTSLPVQQNITLGGKPKAKKRTTSTPPK